MKHIFYFLLAAVSLLTLWSCENDEEDVPYSYQPIRWDIVAQDADGNNLFDPEFEGNILAETTVTYKGQTYNIASRKPSSPEFDIRPPFHFLNPWTGFDSHTYGWHVLVIGEWNVMDRYDNETAVVNWPDGTKTTLSFSLKKAGWGYIEAYIDGEKTSWRNMTVWFKKTDGHFVRIH